MPNEPIDHPFAKLSDALEEVLGHTESLGQEPLRPLKRCVPSARPDERNSPRLASSIAKPTCATSPSPWALVDNDSLTPMTREELRNAVNNACDIMRCGRADHQGLHGAPLVAAVPQVLRGGGQEGKL